MGSEFDEHISLAAGEGSTFAAELPAGWAVGGGINGGFQLAVAANALRATLPDKPDPFALSAYYLSAGTAGPATVSTRILRNGGTTAVAAADLSQDGRTRLTVLGTMGSLADLPDATQTLTRTMVAVPDLAPRDQCISNSLAPPEVRRASPFLERFEMLFDPGCVGWALGEPSDRGMLQAWFRLSDDRDPDPISLLLAVDALPPVSFDLGRPGWAPTLELTAYVRALPAPGWLRLRHETRVIAGGMFEEDCVVFDSEDNLVAQSRQLARLPR